MPNISFIRDTSYIHGLDTSIMQCPSSHTFTPSMYPDEPIPDDCVLPNRTSAFVFDTNSYGIELIQNETMKAPKLCRVRLHCSDLRNAVMFYTGKLGMKVFRFHSNLLTTSYPYNGEEGASMAIHVGYGDNEGDDAAIELTYYYEYDKVTHGAGFDSVVVSTKDLSRALNFLDSRNYTGILERFQLDGKDAVAIRDPDNYKIVIVQS